MKLDISSRGPCFEYIEEEPRPAYSFWLSAFVALLVVVFVGFASCGCAASEFVAPAAAPPGYVREYHRVYLAPDLPLWVRAEADSAVQEWAKALASVADVVVVGNPELATVVVRLGEDGSLSTTGELLVGSSHRLPSGLVVTRVYAGVAMAFDIPVRRVVLHELGHVLGHVSDAPGSALMTKHVDRTQRGYIDRYTAEDVAAAYGVRSECIGYTTNWRDQ